MNFTIKDWNIEEMTGYKPITSFYRDFSIADKFGLGAIKDTFMSIQKNLKSLDYKYITELTMALNWKIWEHYEHDDQKARYYNHLWDLMCIYVDENFTKEELEYYYRVTD